MDTRNTDKPCVCADPSRVHRDTRGPVDWLIRRLDLDLDEAGTSLEAHRDELDEFEPDDNEPDDCEPDVSELDDDELDEMGAGRDPWESLYGDPDESDGPHDPDDLTEHEPDPGAETSSGHEHGAEMNLAIRPMASRHNPDPQLVKARVDSSPRPTSRSRATFDREALVHLDALYGAALRLTRRPSEAEDLVQDTILRAWKKWDQFKQGTNCRAWLFRILTNTFINGYRRRTKEREILEAEHEGRLSDRFFSRDNARSWGDPERGFDNGHLSPVVQEALEGLKPEFRTVVVLSDLEGFSYKEIAEIVDCPIGTVMSRLFRARRALRDSLREHALAFGIAANA